MRCPKELNRGWIAGLHILQNVYEYSVKEPVVRCMRDLCLLELKQFETLNKITLLQIEIRLTPVLILLLV